MTIDSKDKELMDVRGQVLSLGELKRLLEERIRTLDEDGLKQTRSVIEQRNKLEQQNGLLMKENENLLSDNVALKDSAGTSSAGVGERVPPTGGHSDPPGLEELQANLQKEKDKFSRVQTVLWEREREVQQLKEAQQKMMLEDEVGLLFSLITPNVSSSGTYE